jgi:hypothetical protein
MNEDKILESPLGEVKASLRREYQGYGCCLKGFNPIPIF